MICFRRVYRPDQTQLAFSLYFQLLNSCDRSEFPALLVIPLFPVVSYPGSAISSKFTLLSGSDHQLSDGPAFEWSISNLARMVIAITEYPRFADRPVARHRCGEQVGQTPAAPEPILIDRLESERIQKYLTQELSLYSYVSPAGPVTHPDLNAQRKMRLVFGFLQPI